MKERTIQVAVYGTLKAGFGNHRLLANAEHVGDDRLEGFTMWSLGGFPGVKHVGDGAIGVEVYKVNADEFLRLDGLEGYNELNPKQGLYDRELVPTAHGNAWIYIINRQPSDDRLIPSGVWL